MPLRILIADDNPAIRAAMRDVLQTAGDWEIIDAENGEQAVAKAQKFKPHLIILDLVMPAKDGLTASRELARLLPETPILMHSLYYSTKMQIEAAKTGVRKVIPKADSAVLISAVQEVLGANQENAAPAAIDTTEQCKTNLRRTEDKVRDLCTQIIASAKDSDLQPLLVQLREALRLHIEYFRARLLKYPEVTERRVRNLASPPNAPLDPSLMNSTDVTSTSTGGTGSISKDTASETPSRRYTSC
jgi:DNA-binding NarL/FixJ family response regulator